jgi:hypothetical protein
LRVPPCPQVLIAGIERYTDRVTQYQRAPGGV